MATYRKYKTKKGERWLYQLSLKSDPVTGKRKRKTVRGFFSKTEAKHAAELMERKLQGVDFLKGEALFKDVYNMWISEQERQFKPSTMEQKRGKFNKWIIPYFGNFKVENISKTICQNFIDNISKKLTSYKDIIIQLRLIFNWMIKHEYILKNPLDNTVMPVNSFAEDDEEVDNYWTKDEANKFLELLKEYGTHKEYTMFRTLIWAGLRKGELCALTEKDIDKNTHEIIVNKTLYYKNSNYQLLKGKTASAKRRVLIDDETYDTIQKLILMNKKIRLQLNEKPKENFIFVRDDLRPMRVAYVNERLNILINKFNLPQIKVHGLRHTHASLCFAAGASMKEVQTRLGHARLETTMNIYTHIMKESESQVVSKLQNFMKNNQNSSQWHQNGIKNNKSN